MNLNVHRVISYLGLKRAAKRLSKMNILEDFKAIWLGNWLTDMNQASAFFALFDSKSDH